MTVIEFINNSPARRCASIKAGLVEMIGHRPVRLAVIALQSEQVISAAIEDCR